jgi:hypothetical protein
MSEFVYKGLIYQYEVEVRIHKHLEATGEMPTVIKVSPSEYARLAMSGYAHEKPIAGMGEAEGYCVHGVELIYCTEIDDNGCAI